MTGDDRYDDRYMGQTLAVNGPPRERPSRAYRLKRRESPAAGVRRVASGRAEKALEELDEAEGDEFAVSVHRARKDLKKLRAVLRLVRDELGKRIYQAENERYRSAGRLLSGSRDAAVKLETLAALEKRFGDEFPITAARDWRRALEADRDRLEGADGAVAPQIERARLEIAAGRDRIAAWSLGTDSWELLAGGLGRSYRQGRKRMRRTIAEPSAANVHEWRKRAKDVWYQLRLVRGAWPALLDASAEQAHDLADLLGVHHDLAVLGEDLKGRDGIERAGDFEALAGRRQEELLGEAIELGRRFYAERPKAFDRRLAAYWRAWREV